MSATIYRYVPSDKLKKELENRFSYHAPKNDQAERYVLIRDWGLALAEVLTGHCPPSDELRRALDKLDEVVMLANAAIARNE